jgi:hypothetical protein
MMEVIVKPLLAVLRTDGRHANKLLSCAISKTS